MYHTKSKRTRSNQRTSLGELAFAAESDGALRSLVLSGNYTLPTRASLTDAALDLLSRLIELSPERRLSVAEARGHAWLDARGRGGA